MRNPVNFNLAGRFGLRYKDNGFGHKEPTKEPSEYFQKNFNGNTVRPGKGLSKKDVKNLLLGITLIGEKPNPLPSNKYSRIRPRR